MSRITIVVDVESAPLEQIIDQLDKLINVVLDLRARPRPGDRERADARHRRGEPGTRSVIQLVGVFEGQIVGVGHDQVTVMLAGPPRPRRLRGADRPYGIKELQRTGRIALPKLEEVGGGSAASGKREQVDLTTEPELQHQQIRQSRQSGKRTERGTAMAKLYYESDADAGLIRSARWR